MSKTASGYEIGDRVVLTCTFKVDGVLTSPGAVTAYVKDPAGDVSELVTAEDSEGIWSTSYDPTAEGVHRVRFEGTTPAMAAHEIFFTVRTQEVVPP